MEGAGLAAAGFAGRSSGRGVRGRAVCAGDPRPGPGCARGAARAVAAARPRGAAVAGPGGPEPPPPPPRSGGPTSPPCRALGPTAARSVRRARCAGPAAPRAGRGAAYPRAEPALGTPQRPRARAAPRRHPPLRPGRRDDRARPPGTPARAVPPRAREGPPQVPRKGPTRPTEDPETTGSETSRSQRMPMRWARIGLTPLPSTGSGVHAIRLIPASAPTPISVSPFAALMLRPRGSSRARPGRASFRGHSANRRRTSSSIRDHGPRPRGRRCWGAVPAGPARPSRRCRRRGGARGPAATEPSRDPREPALEGPHPEERSAADHQDIPRAARTRRRARGCRRPRGPGRRPRRTRPRRARKPCPGPAARSRGGETASCLHPRLREMGEQSSPVARRAASPRMAVGRHQHGPACPEDPGRSPSRSRRAPPSASGETRRAATQPGSAPRSGARSPASAASSRLRGAPGRGPSFEVRAARRRRAGGRRHAAVAQSGAEVVAHGGAFGWDDPSMAASRPPPNSTAPVILASEGPRTSMPVLPFWPGFGGVSTGPT